MVSGPIILTVEPDYAAFRLLEAGFREIDPEVRLLRAADRREALALLGGAGALDEEKPDLVLLNTSLPDQTGLELLAEIRKNEMSRDIPVIVLLSSPGDVDRYLALGARTFLQKPSNQQDLIALVRQANAQAAVAGSRSTARVFKSTA